MRPPNIEGRDGISIRDLLRNALRMRPDRIIVGECRGAEAFDMLQAMNSGHEGSLTTLHANSPRDALSRLETMILMAGYDMPLRALRRQIASAVHVIVQAERLSGGARRVTSVTEVIGMEGDVIVSQDVFAFQQAGVNAEGRAVGQFVATGIRPTLAPRLRAAGFDLPPALFQQRVLLRT
jgi:pilus assembly protein CpaF